MNRRVQELPEVFLTLPPPCKDWDPSLSKSSSHLILSRVYVACSPAHLQVNMKKLTVGALSTLMIKTSYLSAKATERLDKNCSLSVDVSASHYPRLLQWLVFLRLVPDNFLQIEKSTCQSLSSNKV